MLGGDVGKVCLLIIGLVVLFMHYPSGCKGQYVDRPTRYFLTPTVPQKPDTVKAFIIVDTDGAYTGEDTLFQVLSAKGEPMSYYRKVTREVCMDEKCRLLTVNLYWNIAGRYLGFELPPGEFLSKTDHEPFNAYEYTRLNELLADSLSALANFTYEDILPKANVTQFGIDAITSATSKNMLDHVVEGAAYTTFAMWHLIYGSTRDEVMRLTEAALSPSLVSQILSSSDASDQYWVMSRVRNYVELTPELQDVILSYIDDANFSLAERALRAIKPADLANDSLQWKLFNKFDNTGHSLRKLIIDKFTSAPALNPEIYLGFAEKLQALNGELLVGVLALFSKHEVNDQEVFRKVAMLLENDNLFVSKRGYTFLIQHQQLIEDESVNEKIRHYRHNENF